MPARILGLGLLLALIAWFCWPDATEQAPRPDPAPAGDARPEAAVAAAPAGATPLAAAAARVEVPTDATFLVQGRAVAAVDTPVPHARIRARAFLGTDANGQPIVDSILTADNRGQFVWPLLPPTALTCLELRGEGERIRSYPETFVVAAGDAPPPAFDLWLVPLTAIARGRVLDPQDQPIAGARVGPSSRDGSRTDADGRFEVPVERRPSVLLYASAHGFVELRKDIAIDVDKGEGEAELHLRAANRIHGRVTDSDQRPVAGATVRTFHTIFTDGAMTDAGGHFVLDNLDPSLASHSLFARKTGYVEGKAEVQASAADVEQDLVLERGVEVRGVVTGPQGQPLPAATVFLGFSPSAYNRLDAVSGADGSFAFPCVPAGEQTLNVERRGYSGARRQLQVPKAPAPPLVVNVQLDAGHFLAGRAIGTDGKPVDGVSIAPRLDGEYLDGIRGKTDAEGRFRLDGLPGKGLSLEFHGKGVLRKVQPVANVDRDDLEVELERHGRMAGTVVDGRTGAPLRDFRIRFGTARLLQGEQSGGGYSASWVRGGKAFHDEHGVFRIDEEVRVGSIFALEASADGFAATVDDHVVVALDPDPAQLVIALHPGVVIDGVVRERGTALPIAGARLKAFASGRPLQPHEPNDDEGRPMAVSDARGAFRLQNVGPGEISIAVAHDDWLPLTHGPITVLPGASVPVQELLLDHGVTLTVLVRNADGTPMADAEMLLSGGSERRSGRSDASGLLRIERVAPGEYELILLQGTGKQQAWAFRRALQVERQDCRAEFLAKDGDATLAVVIDSPEPLPQGTQIFVMRKSGAPTVDSPFRGRSALMQPGRTVIPLLPAMELRVTVMCPGEWMGGSTVTTIAGQTVEVRIAMQKFQRRGR